MSKSKKSVSRDPDLVRALGELKRMREHRTNPKSLADIANLLRSREEFQAIDKSSVGRWLSYGDEDSIPPKTQVKIRNAAAVLRKNIATPMKIRVAIISHATEMLPAHLLEKFPEWQAEQGVKVQLKPKGDILEIINSLRSGKAGEAGEADVAIAPKDFVKSNDESIKRFFRIGSIQVSGLFPMDGYTDAEKLAGNVDKLTASGKAVGFLPNGDYENALKQFLEKHKVKMPPIERVFNHDDALAKLKAGKIHAVVGHEVFVANCMQSIQQFLRSGESTLVDNLKMLRQVPAKLFDNAEMDIFINAKVMPAEMARRVYCLLYDSVDYIFHNKGNPDLVQKVNTVLGLNSEDAKSGEDVLKECAYQIRAVNPAVLFQKWKACTD